MTRTKPTKQLPVHVDRLAGIRHLKRRTYADEVVLHVYNDQR